MNPFELQARRHNIKGLPLEFDEFNYLTEYLFLKGILDRNQLHSMVSNVIDYCKRHNQKEMKYVLMYIYDSKYFKKHNLYIDRQMIIDGARLLKEDWERELKEITEYVESKAK